MMADLLLVAGVFVMALALHSFASAAMRRAGSVCLLAASFFAGWLLGGSLLLGALCAGLWLLIPWAAITPRLRAARIPGHRHLEPAQPPSERALPSLEAHTEQAQREGFEEVADLGCEDDGGRIFCRVFRGPDGRSQAAFCFCQRPEAAFYYWALTSRLPGGRVFMTWNYPFIYGLDFFPGLEVCRVAGDADFPAMWDRHRKFLAWHGISETAPLALDAARIIESLDRDFQRQLHHNVARGFLRQDNGASLRYTFRGMLFVWGRVIRDFFQFPP